MNDSSLLYPVLAMVLLTMIVAGLLYGRRVGEMKSRRISPQSVAAARDMTSKLDDVRAADNYRNLFEAPVLFYAAMLTATITHGTTAALVALAWIYVGLRCVHSYIHCTYNRVMHRFSAFVLSMLVLLLIWLLIAWQVVQFPRH